MHTRQKEKNYLNQSQNQNTNWGKKLSTFAKSVVFIWHIVSQVHFLVFAFRFGFSHPGRFYLFILRAVRTHYCGFKASELYRKICSEVHFLSRLPRPFFTVFPLDLCGFSFCILLSVFNFAQASMYFFLCSLLSYLKSSILQILLCTLFFPFNIISWISLHINSLRTSSFFFHSCIMLHHVTVPRCIQLLSHV